MRAARSSVVSCPPLSVVFSAEVVRAELQVAALSGGAQRRTARCRRSGIVLPCGAVRFVVYRRAPLPNWPELARRAVFLTRRGCRVLAL